MPKRWRKIPKMVDTYAAAQIEHDLGKSWADYKKAGNGYLHAATAHGHSSWSNQYRVYNHTERQPKIRVYSSSIAVLIVVIACINFHEFSDGALCWTGREVGVRKVMDRQKSIDCHSWPRRFCYPYRNGHRHYGGVYAVTIV